MSFQSLPLTVREVKATEAVLERLYNSAKLGLKGDALALNAGLLPIEFRRLCQMDPIADFAVQKGWADQEAQMATVVRDAALAGDSKAAMDILRHRHDWQAAQKVEVVGSQNISISIALEQAQKRLLANADDDTEDAKMIEPQHRANGARALTNQPNEAADGYANFDTREAAAASRLQR